MFFSRPLRTTKPRLNDLFGRSPALTRGMVFCALCNEGAGVTHDLIYGSPGPSGTVWGQGASYGLCSGNTSRFADDTRLNGPNGVTAAVWFKVTGMANGSYPTPIGKSDYTGEGNNRGWGFQIQAPDDANQPTKLWWIIFNNNNFADSYRLAGTTTYVAGQSYFACCNYDPATRNWVVYGDGGQESAGVGNAPTALLASTNGLRLGDPAANGALVYAAMVWNRALKATEVEVLRKMPFQYSAARRRLRALKSGSSASSAASYYYRHLAGRGSL
jgi:hypothetical protein